MTLPNKEEGITPGVLWAVSNPSATTYDLLDPDGTTFGGLTERLDWRTQPNVVEFLKARVQQMSSWNKSTEDVWGGLRRGTPGSPVPLVLGTLEALAQRILPVDLSETFDTVEDALGAFDEGMSALWEFLGGLNPLDPNFDPVAAVENFVTGKLLPTGLFEAVSAVLDWAKMGLNLFGIPGLDEAGFSEAGSNLMSLLGNPDVGAGSMFNPITAGAGMLRQVLTPAGALSSQTMIPPNLLSLLAPGNLNNLLPDPGFDDPTFLAGNNIWQHVDTLGRSTPLGCVRVIADGTVKRLIGVPIGAAEGQSINLGIHVWWSALVDSGISISLCAKAYDLDHNEIPDPDFYRVAWLENTTTNSSTYPGAPAQQPPNPAADPEGWVHLQGIYQAPAGTAFIRLCLEVSATALSGTILFDDGEYMPGHGSGFLDAGWLGNIGNIPMIPGFNIEGIQGLVNIFESLQFGVVDNLYNAFGETSDSNVPVGNLFSLAQQIAQNAFGALMFSADNKIVIENKTNKPNAVGGLQSSGEQTFDLRSLPSGTTWPTTAVAPGNAILGFVRASQVATKGFIDMLLGISSGTPTNIFVNVYSMNISTGNLSRLMPGINIASLVQVAPSNGAAYAQALIPGADQFAVAASEQLVVEIVNAGTVNLNVVTKTLPSTNNPNVYPRNYGATRVLASSGGNSPTTVAAGNLTYTGVEPYANIGIAAVPDDYHLPEEFQATTSGSVLTYTIPTFARVLGSTIDIQILGAGGGGMGNYGTLTTYTGGNGGDWATKRIVYGVDVPLGTTSITYYAGVGGGSAGYWNTGGNGQGSYIEYNHPTLGTQRVTAGGGAGGGKSGTSGNSGKSPGSNTFQSITRRGGNAVGMNADGNPYGGGAGGAGPYQFGGTGAPGTIWFRAIQAAA